ncbi:hypothetical protein CEXT_124121 [Caerostris extrusa]|uniref:Uncharacterized protein n=1 Tax=Caerostris extrusa TaxID=172846 RepID=A0AAV4MKL1_CAEEX|nr:hypothetical protein CEXT_124121 [Caerostris extrusa]
MGITNTGLRIKALEEASEIDSLRARERERGRNGSGKAILAVDEMPQPPFSNGHFLKSFFVWPRTGCTISISQDCDLSDLKWRQLDTQRISKRGINVKTTTQITTQADRQYTAEPVVSGPAKTLNEIITQVLQTVIYAQTLFNKGMNTPQNSLGSPYS